MFKTLRRTYWVTEMFLKRHMGIMLKTTGIVLAAITIFFLFAVISPNPKRCSVSTPHSTRQSRHSLALPIQAKL